MKIVEYNTHNDMIVEFQDEYKCRKQTYYQFFKKGTVKNPYDKTIYNIGCLGDGNHMARENGIMTPSYICWCNIMKRCYSPKYQSTHKSYIGCTVCDEWLIFQNFAKWYKENYYEIENERVQIDKDILVKNNKIYSPKTCVFSPQRINLLIVTKDACRGKYSIGVRESSDGFYAQTVDSFGKPINLGRYSTPYNAFLAYKGFREHVIKIVANEYKDRIPNRLYEGLLNYEIDIDD